MLPESIKGVVFDLDETLYCQGDFKRSSFSNTGAWLAANQEPDGYWGRPESFFHKDTGTAWRWLLLHELGLDPMHPSMQKAARSLLDITK